ncbi:MAG: serine hydrolase domain-containing protein [Bacteroidota bacterium]
MNRLLLIVNLCLLMSPLFAQIRPEQQSQVDKLFEPWNSTHTPGLALGIVKEGELVYTKGYGMADLEHDIPLSSRSVFYAASVSKQFVTFAILLLEEQGKLSLDADIQTYLPDFPRYESPLSIRHFIHHTSGVRDYLTLWSLAGNSYLDHIDEHAVYELIKRQQTLNFSPGEKYLYSNSCYFMLAMIVEKVSGQSIKEFAAEHMFGPLGMKHTRFHDDVNRLIKNRAFSYQDAGESYDNLIMRFDLVGSGGLYTTVEDLYLWDQNFYQNQLGKGTNDLIEKMHEDGLLNNGESSGYACGVVNDAYKGLKTVGHGGALAGYRTYLLRFPEQNFSVIILANVSSFNSAGKAHEVADIFLTEMMDPPEQSATGEAEEAAQVFLTLSPEDMNPFIGSYLLPNGFEIEISLQADSLHVRQDWNQVTYTMSPVAKNVFMIPGNSRLTMEFSDLSEGKTNVMIVNQGGSDIVCQRKGGVMNEDLTAYVGSYYSEELLTHYEISLKEEILVWHIGYQKPQPLKWIGKDQFVSEGLQFAFEREGKELIGFRLNAGRVTDLGFRKE